MAGLKRWGLPIGIFGLALVVRLIGLDGFLTADEPLWIDRSRHFAGGLLFADYECPATDRGRSFTASGWECTLQSEHPGVTTMWAGSLGLLIHYWQAVRPTGVDLPTFLASIDMGQLDPALVAPVRWPVAVIAALFVALFFVLVQRLLAERVALVAALLLALNPYHIALSRVLHHDALNTTFMVLSLLALTGYWLRGWRWYWLPISGVLAGLALLSKPTSWFLIPFVVVLAGLTWLRKDDSLSGGRGERMNLASLSPQAKRSSFLWRLAGQAVIWGMVAGLTYVAFFPAVWVIPGEVIRVAFSKSIEAAEEGHSLYFLGRVSDDPGPLFYPLSWLLQATPLEIVGLLALAVATFKRSNVQTFNVFRQRPVEAVLALFGGLFLIFVTLSAKKLVRYFLPAFPIIEIFVAFGLLWLYDTFKRSNVQTFKRLSSYPSLLIGVIILLGQGGLALAHYPYYFTYFNPLLGGAAGAARLTTVGFGEGVNEAAAYLNQQPEAQSLQVAVCGNDDLFSPFFRGDVRHCREAEIMQADYVVYYLKTIQLQRDKTTWSYFNQHYPPAYRVNLHGLDYVLIYRSPIEHDVSVTDNSLPNILTTFGYNLAADGTLTLFWQDFGLGHKQLWVGLTAPGETGGTPYWVACAPAPNFIAEVDSSGAMVESVCPLATATDAQAGLYDLRLGLADDAGISLINSSQLALVMMNQMRRFEAVDSTVVLAELARQALPSAATPLDIAYGDRLRLVGYQLEPAIWRSGQLIEVVLYWQPMRQPDFGLASAVQVVLRLSAGQTREPLLTVVQPMLPASVTNQDWVRGSVMLVHYPLSAPATLQPGQYALDVCLTIAASGEVLLGAVADTAKSIECLPLSVRVAG